MAMGKQRLVIPDLPEPILAYRVWRCFRGDLDSALIGSERWPVGAPLEARCIRLVGSCGPAPAANGKAHYGFGCGIYALKSLEYLTGLYDTDSFLAFGQVLLSGKVYEHEHGFRAERARVHGIYDTGFLRAGEMAEKHGVPLLPIDVAWSQANYHRYNELPPASVYPISLMVKTALSQVFSRAAVSRVLDRLSSRKERSS